MCYYFFCFYSSVQQGKKGFHVYGHLRFVVCVWVFGRGFLGGGKEMFCQFVWILGFKVQTN